MDDCSKQPTKILVVDDDPVLLRMADAHLSGMSHYEVIGCEDPHEAWRLLQDQSSYQDFALIVLDWVLPELSGLALFNRIRSHPHYGELPILVLSSSLTQDDFALLREYPVTKLIQKPFTKQLVQRSVNELIDEAASHNKSKRALAAIAQMVEVDGRKAVKAFQKMASSLKDPLPVAVILTRSLRVNGHLEAAEKLARWILESDDRNLAAITELGKILHQGNRHREAMLLLRAATKYSPKNLERLLLMGKISLIELKPQQARQHFKSALEIDAASEHALAGKMVSTNMEQFITTYSRDAIPKSFASMLNMIGITLVRNKNLEVGTEQYKAALKLVSSNDDSARLAFNLGLAYFRWKKLPDALEWFQRSASLSDVCRGRSSVYVDSIETMITEAGNDEASTARKAPPPSETREVEVNEEIESVSDSDEVVQGDAEAEVDDSSNEDTGVEAEVAEEKDDEAA